MNEQQPSSWQIETPTLGQILLRSLGRAFLVALGLSLLFFVGKWLYLFFQDEFQLRFLLAQSGQLMGLILIVTFPLFLISQYRKVADRAFTLAGFVATFFGLAILSVFFVQLGDEVAQWFRFTPVLIEAENKKHQKVIEDFVNQKKRIDAEILAMETERDDAIKKAATEEDKKELRGLYEMGLEELRTDTMGQNRFTIAQRRLRPDTSATSTLAYFLSAPPDKDAQDSGIGPALWGSVWLGLITILFAVPVGVGAALYLEEYRQEGRLARIIQININNLAGVPSVVFGILGGFVFVYLFKKVHQYDSSIDPFNLLGGGLTLGLLTLPMIIVSAQEAIRAVPSSLREGAYALGATKWQAIWTIVLPSAVPGIMTGAILSLSRAIGEAAPLVLFGAQQYVDRNPTLFKPFTALPLQIYQWCGEPAITVEGQADSVDIWKYNAAVASTVLLLVLLSMNGIAIYLRHRGQRQMRN